LRQPNCHRLHEGLWITDDDEIPSSIGKENITINVPTQRGTQWSPESLSGDKDDDSKANIVAAQTASAKPASGRESNEEIRIPYANELSTDGPVYKSPEFHRSWKACITQLDIGEKELDIALEEYANASWRLPSMKNSTKKAPEFRAFRGIAFCQRTRRESTVAVR
jgi:hypothetical protein